ncbi:MAG: methionyl-tRNA formyltransferase [Clostridiales bacterium]|nr:methionyl-tRNA formyltransferase [Clostridiales bacterium]
MRILFMGTPDFAAASLEAMAKAGFNIVGAVSQPDKPKGRGHKLMPTEVKKTAQSLGIPVYQPERLKDNQLMPVLEELKPDLIVVTAYGKILPPYIINYPKYGCINVHASLLPKYRGAAPIQWAVINGEKITGVTTMKMDEGLDTGDMLMTRQTPIGEYETAEELFLRLAKLGGELLVETINNIESITPVPQKHEEHTYAPMISKEMGHIDWTKSASDIIHLICGMNSWPMAYADYKGQPVKISSARKAEGRGKPGEILSLDKGRGLKVACGEDCIYISEAQFFGAKRMNVEDYARGHSIEIGEILK